MRGFLKLFLYSTLLFHFPGWVSPGQTPLVTPLSKRETLKSFNRHENYHYDADTSVFDFRQNIASALYLVQALVSCQTHQKRVMYKEWSTSVVVGCRMLGVIGCTQVDLGPTSCYLYGRMVYSRPWAVRETNEGLRTNN